jgi:hypothetical protein
MSVKGAVKSIYSFLADSEHQAPGLDRLLYQVQPLTPHTHCAELSLAVYFIRCLSSSDDVS